MFGDLPTKGWQFWMTWALIIVLGLVGLLLMGIKGM